MPYADPEKRRAMARVYSKAYAQRHPERRYESTLRWRKKNWDKHLATAARYRKRHPDRVKDTNRASEDKRRGMGNERKKEWARKNREKHLASMAKARIKRKLAISENGGTCTPDQWKARCAFYGWRCAYCSMSLTETTVEIDHVIPIASGGTGWPANLVPSCRSCNATKHTKRWLPAWLRKKES